MSLTPLGSFVLVALPEVVEEKAPVKAAEKPHAKTAAPAYLTGAIISVGPLAHRAAGDLLLGDVVAFLDSKESPGVAIEQDGKKMLVLEGCCLLGKVTP